jgi:hypothetical protein
MENCVNLGSNEIISSLQILFFLLSLKISLFSMKRHKSLHARRRFPAVTVFGLVILLFLVAITVTTVQHQTQYKQQAATSQFQFMHQFGAFSIGGATSVATSLGLTADLQYGYDPGASGSKGGMQLIDDMPDEYIRQFAKDNSMTNLTNSMTAHLKAVQNNANIVAYWVLDDTNGAGTAKQALVQVTTLIHQYTPGKPSICGFTGNSRPWPASKADNFSPQGCDMIAPYIYPKDGEAWDLSDILPTMEAAFKARGWDINTTPMVGVPLSYGGANGYTVPTAQQVETEAKAFCQAGATSLIWYDFSTGTNGSDNSGVQQGIKAAIADCKAIWGASTSIAPPAGPTSIVPSFVCEGGGNCAGTPVPTVFQGTTPQPSSMMTPLPNPSNTSLPSTIPTSPPNQNPSISVSPLTGGNGQNIINVLLQLLDKILQFLLQLFGIGTGGRGHSHHHGGGFFQF